MEDPAVDIRQWVVLQLGGWAWGSQTFTIKIKFVTKTAVEPQTRADSLDKRPKLWNMDVRFGLWNIRSLYRAGSLMTVSRELARYKLDLVGVQEIRWEGGGTEPAREYTFSGSTGDQMGGWWHRTCRRIHI
jgi:hypothetical protein